MLRHLLNLATALSLLLCLTVAGLWVFTSGDKSPAPPAQPSNAPVHRLLSRPLPQVSFQNVALVDVIDFLQDVSGCRIGVDWAALHAAGVSANSVVKLSAKDALFGDVLADLFPAGKGVAFVARGNDLFVSTRSELNKPPKPGATQSSAPAPPARPAPTSGPPGVEWVAGVSRWTLAADRGALRLWRTPSDPAAAYQPPRPKTVRDATTPTTRHGLAGLLVERSGGPLDSLRVDVPFWMLLILTGFAPVAWTVRAFRRASRRGSHLCAHCGYDLRATPDRCPECGTPGPQRATPR